jgi:hypothetical protein
MALNCRGGEPRQLLEVEQPPPWPDRAAVVDPSRHFEPSICCDAQWLPFDMIGYRSRVLGAAHEATGIHHDCRECRGLFFGRRCLCARARLSANPSGRRSVRPSFSRVGLQMMLHGIDWPRLEPPAAAMLVPRLPNANPQAGERLGVSTLKSRPLWRIGDVGAEVSTP